MLLHCCVVNAHRGVIKFEPRATRTACSLNKNAVYPIWLNKLSRTGCHRSIVGLATQRFDRRCLRLIDTISSGATDLCMDPGVKIANIPI